VEQAAGAPFDINALADAFKQRLKDLQDQLAQDRAKNDAALRAALDAIQRQQAAEDFNNNNDRNNQIDPNLLARDNNRNDQPVIPPPAIPPVTIPPSDNNDNQAPLPEAKNDEEDEDPGFTPPPMFPQPPPPTTPPIVIGDTQPRFSDSSADRRRDRDSSLLPSQLNTTNAGILEELRLRNALAFAQQQAPYVNGRPNVGTSMAARLSGASGARPVGTGRAPFGGSTNLGTAGQLANGPAGARTNVPSAISNGDRRL
jgi:hypothetical protein